MVESVGSGRQGWRLRVFLGSAAATRTLGRALGGSLIGGEMLALTGPLGSGKTTLTRGVALGLGVEQWVRSPSFTIVSRLNGRLPLYHIDLYRLEPPVDLGELGWADADDGRAIAVVEWAEKAALPAPQRTVEISFCYAKGGREVEIHGTEGTRHVYTRMARYDGRSL